LPFITSAYQKGNYYTFKLFFQMITMYKMPNVKIKIPNKKEVAYFQTPSDLDFGL